VLQLCPAAGNEALRHRRVFSTDIHAKVKAPLIGVIQRNRGLQMNPSVKLELK
jgi:hypothetical protein